MELLEKLVTTAAVSGQEHRLRQLVLQETKTLFDQVRIDPMGSIIGLRKPSPGKRIKPSALKSKQKPKRIMLAAHMDQIGFVVRHIDDKGFVRVHNIGGFDTRNLFARLVTLCPDVDDPSKDFPGVMNPGGKPIHIASPDDTKKIPEISDLVIDTGLTPDEVKTRLKIGDMVVIHAPCTQVGSTVVSQCLDNRVAVWIAIGTMRQLVQTGHTCEVACVFTVQEEVGLRGAMTSAYDLKPDIGIGIDTTLAVDTPGVPDDQRVTQLGGGAALTVMDGSVISDPALVREFETVAEKNKIKVQRSILPRGGTDTAALQRAGAGCRAMTLSCPTRYIHTVTEMVHRDDLTACRDLLAAYLAQA